MLNLFKGTINSYNPKSQTSDWLYCLDHLHKQLKNTTYLSTTTPLYGCN